ncbi:hypothetical protein ACFRCG_41705 [Embleya sp. NPDC056575]|uniref:hypothetical protein n=1 Tax=unclassified Embleya TaxID=2699296 RepID=UPI0036A28934
MTEPAVRRFRRGPVTVDAVQVAGDDTGNTARAIATWCDGAPAGTWDQPRIHVWEHPDGPDDAMTARVGMWITREPDGRYRVHRDAEFRATHEEVDMTEPTYGWSGDAAARPHELAVNVGLEHDGAEAGHLRLDLDQARILGVTLLDLVAPDTARRTADTITDDDLDALYASRDALYAERDQLAAAAQRVRDLHQPIGDGLGYVDGGSDYGDIAPACSTCGTHDEYAVPWPCATIRALDNQERA